MNPVIELSLSEGETRSPVLRAGCSEQKSPQSLAAPCKTQQRYSGSLAAPWVSFVLLQLKDPLELFLKRRNFPPCSGFLSHRDMTQAVERDVKPIPSLRPLSNPSSSYCRTENSKPNAGKMQDDISMPGNYEIEDRKICRRSTRGCNQLRMMEIAFNTFSNRNGICIRVI